MDYVEGNTLSELDFHIDEERNEVTALERTKPVYPALRPIIFDYWYS